jgi:hypothetical protein
MLTSAVGKHLPVDVVLSSGRFAPLEGQIYTIPAFFAPTPLCFYTINAIELLLAAWLLVTLGRLGLAGRKSIWPYLLAAAVMVTPGFIECWFRLFVPEKEEFILLGLFLLFFLKIQKSSNSWLFVPCLFAAVMALLCKETAFILLGGVGLFHLCLEKEYAFRTRSLDIFLIALSCTWLGVYYCFIYRFRGPNLYITRSDSPWHALQHTLASNALHDPWIIIFLLVLLALRLRQVAMLKQQVQPVLDSILLSSLFFYLAYCVLRMANIYYLLPLYVFVPYVVCRFVSTPILKQPFRPALLILLAVLFLSQLFSGMREVLTWKFAPANFQAVLKAISIQITSSHNKFNVFLSGSSRGSGIEVYTNLAIYLSYTGFHPDQFDIKSNTPVDSLIPYLNTLHGTSNCPYSYCNPMENDKLSKGDYVLLTPYDSLYARSVYRDRSHYQLVFKTNTPIVPDLSVKTLAGHIFPHTKKDTGSGMIDTNFYLYKVL